MDSICKATVGNYHSLIEFLMGCATKSGDYFTDGGEEGIERVKNDLLPRFRNAKIFSIDPAVATQVHSVIDTYVAEESGSFSTELKARLFSQEQLCTNTFVSFLDELSRNQKDWEKWDSEKGRLLYRSFICDSNNYLPFPTNLPFDNMYIGYGEGVYLEYFGKLVRDNYFKDQMVYVGESPDPMQGLPIFSERAKPRVLGHYVSSDGYVIEFLALNTPAGEMLTYALMRSLDSAGRNWWTVGGSLLEWFIPTIIDLINENNKTFVFKGNYDKNTRREIGKKHRKIIKKKKGRHVLPAYYVIDVKPKAVRKYTSSKLARNSTTTGRALTHRHDRDGHERVLVRRGDLPLHEDERELLTLRGYDVYTHSQPSNENERRLVIRKLPLRQEGEWLAVKTSWVNSTVVGGEDLPYKPAVRRVSSSSIGGVLKGLKKESTEGFKSF